MVSRVTVDDSPVPATRTASEAEDFVSAWEAFNLATRRARARLSREDGLTPSQLHLLEPLDGPDSLTVGRIADLAGVTAPTATRMLDALERAGVVARSADRDDRRCVNVRLTAPGRKLVRAKRVAVSARRAELFARLSPEEGDEATRLLARLADLIDEL